MALGEVGNDHFQIIRRLDLDAFDVHWRAENKTKVVASIDLPAIVSEHQVEEGITRLEERVWEFRRIVRNVQKFAVRGQEEICRKFVDGSRLGLVIRLVKYREIKVLTVYLLVVIPAELADEAGALEIKVGRDLDLFGNLGAKVALANHALLGGGIV